MHHNIVGSETRNSSYVPGMEMEGMGNGERCNFRLLFFLFICYTCSMGHAHARNSVFPFPFAITATFMLITVKNVAGVVPGRACARKPSCAAGCRQPGAGWAVLREWEGREAGVQVLELT